MRTILTLNGCPIIFNEFEKWLINIFIIDRLDAS